MLFGPAVTPIIAIIVDAVFGGYLKVVGHSEKYFEVLVLPAFVISYLVAALATLATYGILRFGEVDTKWTALIYVLSSAVTSAVVFTPMSGGMQSLGLFPVFALFFAALGIGVALPVVVGLLVLQFGRRRRGGSR